MRPKEKDSCEESTKSMSYLLKTSLLTRERHKDEK